jgi:hypothetical protein
MHFLLSKIFIISFDSNAMSEKSSSSFAEFCEKINNDATYRKEYIENPCLLVSRDLGIQLSDTQCKELEKTVKDLQELIPNFRLFVVNESPQLTPSGGGPQAH